MFHHSKTGAIRVTIGDFTVQVGFDFSEAAFIRVWAALKTLC